MEREVGHWHHDALRRRMAVCCRAAVQAGLAVFALAARAESDCHPEAVLPEGVQLAELLDSMHVESHWIAGHHVDWETGDPDGRPVPPEGHHSHCSAFAAAVAEKVAVEVLHPPNHSQALLANAQCRWLRGKGRGIGWQSVQSPLQAQQLANRGMLVAACYVAPDRLLPGHIAIVRPQRLCRERIESEGPQVTQAGIENYRSTTLAEGFRHHPHAWPRRTVRFYAHAILAETWARAAPIATLPASRRFARVPQFSKRSGSPRTNAAGSLR